MPFDSMFPLDMLRPGQWAHVMDVCGDPSWVCRMAELGLRSGSRVQLLQSGVPCMLRVDGCKLCLRSGSSAQILVRPIEASESA